MHSSGDVKSQRGDGGNGEMANNNFNHRMLKTNLKTYESLKSQVSTSSQGSTGSKMTASSTGSDKSTSLDSCISSPGGGGSNSLMAIPYLAVPHKRGYHPPHHYVNKSTWSSSQTTTPNTNSGILPASSDIKDSLAEGTMKGLSFVSPKSGVYRQMPDSRKHRQNCSIM